MVYVLPVRTLKLLHDYVVWKNAIALEQSRPGETNRNSRSQLIYRQDGAGPDAKLPLLFLRQRLLPIDHEFPHSNGVRLPDLKEMTQLDAAFAAK